jgi:Transposase DDE domain
MMQTKDLLKWKKKRKYGHRWMAETVFSTLKRTFGEYVSATKFQHMVKEMMINTTCLEEYSVIGLNRFKG